MAEMTEFKVAMAGGSTGHGRQKLRSWWAIVVLVSLAAVGTAGKVVGEHSPSVKAGKRGHPHGSRRGHNRRRVGFKDATLVVDAEEEVPLVVTGETSDEAVKKYALVHEDGKTCSDAFGDGSYVNIGDANDCFSAAKAMSGGTKDISGVIGKLASETGPESQSTGLNSVRWNEFLVLESETHVGCVARFHGSVEFHNPGGLKPSTEPTVPAPTSAKAHKGEAFVVCMHKASATAETVPSAAVSAGPRVGTPELGTPEHLSSTGVMDMVRKFAQNEAARMCAGKTLVERLSDSAKGEPEEVATTNATASTASGGLLSMIGSAVDSLTQPAVKASEHCCVKTLIIADGMAALRSNTEGYERLLSEGSREDTSMIRNIKNDLKQVSLSPFHTCLPQYKLKQPIATKVIRNGVNVSIREKKIVWTKYWEAYNAAVEAYIDEGWLGNEFNTNSECRVQAEKYKAIFKTMCQVDLSSESQDEFQDFLETPRSKKMTTWITRSYRRKLFDEKNFPFDIVPTFNARKVYNQVKDLVDLPQDIKKLEFWDHAKKIDNEEYVKAHCHDTPPLADPFLTTETKIALQIHCRTTVSKQGLATQPELSDTENEEEGGGSSPVPPKVTVHTPPADLPSATISTKQRTYVRKKVLPAKAGEGPAKAGEGEVHTETGRRNAKVAARPRRGRATGGGRD